MKDADYMRLALAEARLAAAEGEVPVGAVLVRGDKVLAQAHNRVEQCVDPTAHAELLCLRAAAAAEGGWRFSDCTLYVTSCREDPKGADLYVTLEPCAMCAGALVNARLGRVVFGAFEPRTGCCGSVFDLLDHAFLHTVPAVGGLLEEECTAALQAFFVGKRS